MYDTAASGSSINIEATPTDERVQMVRRLVHLEDSLEHARKERAVVGQRIEEMVKEQEQLRADLGRALGITNDDAMKTAAPR